MEIFGKITYQSVGTGFWGIIGDDGQKWRAEKMPSQWQEDGLNVHVEAELSKNQMSLFMWGKAIKIKSIKAIED